MKRLAIVFNPCAGLRRANKYIPQIVKLYESKGFETSLFETRKRGDGVNIVKEQAEKADIIVCVGGDGTLNEVITGMIDSGMNKPIGYIPSGSTNDFANSLNLSRDIMTAAKDIMEGKPCEFDIGRFNTKYFNYIASCGAFTRASYSTPQPKKNAIGHLAYILEGMKEIPNIHPVHLCVETNGKNFEGDYIFAAVCNSTSVGGILSLNENIVDMSDGKFELMLIKMPLNIAQLGQIVLALKNQDYDCEMIDFCSSDRFRIQSSSELDWTLDGEHGKGNKTIEIETLHNAVSLIVNER